MRARERERERERLYENINSMIIYLKYLCWRNTLQVYVNTGESTNRGVAYIFTEGVALGSFLEG